MWKKHSYGSDQHDKGHWTISNGHLNFDIHVTRDGSGRREKYPDGYIVHPEQAEEYANKILNLLNDNNLQLENKNELCKTTG